MLKSLYYVAEFFLPNNKAYTIHVVKMLNALNENLSACELIIPYKDNKYNYNNLKENFNLKKKKFFIKIKKKFKNSFGFDPLIHNTETKRFLILNKINNFKKYKAIIFITKHKILYKIYKKLIINKKNIILNCML